MKWVSRSILYPDMSSGKKGLMAYHCDRVGHTRVDINMVDVNMIDVNVSDIHAVRSIIPVTVIDLTRSERDPRN
jgi:hypothetical protein